MFSNLWPFQCCGVLCRLAFCTAACWPAPDLALAGLSLFSLTGDVHIAIMDRSGQLEVEVIEARGLTPKPGSKSLPGEDEQLRGRAATRGILDMGGPSREGYVAEFLV